jgi:ribonuclease J
MVKNSSALKVIPLGGLDEIGKNITVIEYQDEIILVDCGSTFPEDDMLGIDLVIPDFNYIIKNKDKVKALILTHGHEDHIGAIPYLLKEINVPIYGTKLTLGFVEYKLTEHNLLDVTKLITITQGQSFTVGNFKIEFIATTHSIADSVALAITTPLGVILHTGDFKVDYTPIEGQSINLSRFSELGKQGVLLLMSDSTNIETPGFTMSERSVGDTFAKIFNTTTGRIIITSFASNIHRTQQIINAAFNSGRKVCFSGRSMVKVMNVALKLEYINLPEGILIDIENINSYRPEEIVIITTGSQGEPMSALARMAAGQHKNVTIVPGDTIILSSSAIPGNEKGISRLINELSKKGAKVIYQALAEVHVSGHACQEELKLILSLVKPKYFMPVHGEFRHLTLHSALAESMGVPKENIFTLTIGSVLEINSIAARVTSVVPSGRVLVDGFGVGDIGAIVLRDRKHLAEDGLIIVVLVMNSETGELISGPDVISRGFVYVKESEELIDQIRDVARLAIEKLDENQKTDWTEIKANIRFELRSFIYEVTKRNPMILPIIMEISD